MLRNSVWSSNREQEGQGDRKKRMLRFLQTLLRTFIKIIVLVILASIFYSSYQQIQIKFPNAVHHRQRITALKADGTNNDASLKIQTDNDENLIWFMHVTDLHVSGFEDQKRHEMFRSFITEAVFHVKPKVVLVTGDLTDAKTYDGYGSQQNLWEWQTYKRIIDETGVKNITTWLDIRGNHDVFNVMDMHDEENYYPKFSVQGSEDWNQLTYRHRVEYGKKNSISFIGIDACPVPGPRRPFNFFGVVNKTMEENILRLAEQARKDSNITIFFGHYPTSSVSSETIEFENLMESGLAYFCGHFHNFGGLVPAFFALHPTGMLELELGDWKVSRLFRVAAIDNNMISFVDQKFGDWPVILVTLPKYKNIMTPSHEPVENIAHASHIRVLVFSTSDIAQVSIELPDGLSFREMHNVKGSPIYVYPWDAREYRKGKHDLRVYAKDAAGNSKMIKHSFQLDTESKNIVLSVLGRLFLMIDLFILVQIAFFLSNVAAVLPIWLFKEDRLGHRIRRTGSYLFHINLDKSNFFLNGLRRFSNTCWIRNSIYIMVVSNACLPWFIGEIMKNVYGIVFSWGMITKFGLHSYQLTLTYAAKHILFYILPIELAIIGFLILHGMSKSVRISKIWYIPFHIIFAYVTVFNLFCLVLFHYSYSPIALYTNVLKLYSGVLLSLYLWIRIVRLVNSR